MTQQPPKPCPEAELLEDGQEEVFSRTEVEQGRIEHSAQAGDHDPERSEKRSEAEKDLPRD